MNAPFNPDDEIAKQADQERRQLVLDYKATFAGERGQRVLNDMKRIFGFERPSAAYGMTHGDVMLREGMKMPIYHIESRLKTNFRKPARQKRALSNAPPAEQASQ